MGDLSTWSVKELRKLILEKGMRCDDCFEKSELVQRAREAQEAGQRSCDTVPMLRAELQSKQAALKAALEREQALHEDEELVGTNEGSRKKAAAAKQRLFLEESIHFIEEALNMQSQIGDLQEHRASLQGKLETLEGERKALEKAEDMPKATFMWKKQSIEREKKLAEHSIAGVEEAMHWQNKVEEDKKALRLAKARLEQLREEPTSKTTLTKERQLRSEVRSLERSLERAQRSAVRANFEAWDKDSSGCISREELKKTFMALGVSEDVIDKMFDSMDVDKDGEIDIEEFMAWTFQTRRPNTA